MRAEARALVCMIGAALALAVLALGIAIKTETRAGWPVVMELAGMAGMIVCGKEGGMLQ